MHSILVYPSAASDIVSFYDILCNGDREEVVVFYELAVIRCGGVEGENIGTGHEGGKVLACES